MTIPPRLSARTEIATSAVKVVDASALAAFLFMESNAEAIVTRLENTTLLAPTLIYYELANVCLNKIRRDQARRDEYFQSFEDLHRIVLHSLDVDPAGVLALAEATGLTAYDASYLWLAWTRNAELITLDKKLAAAARAV